MFLTTGGAQPAGVGERLLAALAEELRKMPNEVAVEGRTDSVPLRNALPTSGYSNWELSTDRANAARRRLHLGGVRAQQDGGGAASPTGICDFQGIRKTRAIGGFRLW